MTRCPRAAAFLLSLALAAPALGQEPEARPLPLNLRLDAELGTVPGPAPPAGATGAGAEVGTAVSNRVVPDPAASEPAVPVIPVPGDLPQADALPEPEAAATSPAGGTVSTTFAVAAVVLLAGGVFLIYQMRSLRAAVRERRRRRARRGSTGQVFVQHGPRPQSMDPLADRAPRPGSAPGPMAVVRAHPRAEPEEEAVERVWQEVDTLLAFGNHEQAADALRRLRARFPDNADVVRRLRHVEAESAAAKHSEGARQGLNLAPADEPTTFEDPRRPG